jgi:CubicO group peptidase (beta-lactamase class C family)
MAYEGITGEKFGDAFDAHVAKPLKLTRSFWDASANDSNALFFPLTDGLPVNWSLGPLNP